MLNTPMMRVALLTDTFSKKMGYLQSVLPKYLARLGAQVHVVSMDLPPYYWIDSYEKTYGDFCEELQPGSVEACDGYILHVLAHRRVTGYMRMEGLRRKLRSIRPDIVQTMAVVGWIPLDAAFHQPFLGYKLFTGCHMTASVFPLASQALPWWNGERLRCTLMRAAPGRFVSFFTEKCYGATADCADVAVRFFGVPQNKMDVCPLGVDTELFSPIINERDRHARATLRRRLGFRETDIVCIYTGRFTEDKNPLLLARAVERLVNSGQSFRGLFIGNGVQGKAIESCSGCSMHPFVPVQELGDFFRAADIGVWPAQESMSMLDAAACGLPIVVNNTMVATERICGNGVTHRLNDLEDLVRVLRGLQDLQTRQRLGSSGARKMAQGFSWEAVAKRRLRDYQAALGITESLTLKHVSEDLAGVEKVASMAGAIEPNRSSSE